MALRPIPVFPAAPRVTPRPGSGGASQARLSAAFDRGASLVAAKQAAAKGAPSLWDQVSSLVTGLPGGLVHMGVDAARDIQGIGRTVKDAATGQLGNDATDYFPLLTGVGESFKETGKDIVHPSRFLEAAKEGRIVSKIAEDVGNAAIVLGPLSKGLGAAAEGGAKTAAGAAAREAALEQAGEKGIVGPAAERFAAHAERLVNPNPNLTRLAARVGEHLPPEGLRRAADITSRIAEPAEKVMNAPARVWAAPAKMIAGVDLPTRYFGEAEGGGPRRVGVIPALRDSSVVQHALESPRGEALVEKVGDYRQKIRNARDVTANFLLPASAKSHLAAAQIDKMLAPARDILGGDTDLEYANHLVRAGMAPVLEAAQSATAELGEDAGSKLMAQVFGVEQQPSPAAIDTALAYEHGTLDPAVRDKMDRAWEFEQRALGQVEQVKLSGEGRKNGPMSEAQLADTPIPANVDYRLSRLRDRADTLRAELEGDGGRQVGLRETLAQAQAKVPEASPADLLTRAAQARARRAGGLAREQEVLLGQADVGERQASRLGEKAAAAESRLGAPAVERLLGRDVTGPLERQVPRSNAAATEAERRAAGAEVARGRIGTAAEGAPGRLEFGDPWEPSPAPTEQEAARFVREVRGRARDQMRADRVALERQLSADTPIVAVPAPGSPMRDLYDEIQGVLAEGSSSTKARFRNLSLNQGENAGTRPLFSRSSEAASLDELVQSYIETGRATADTAERAIVDDIRAIKQMKEAEGAVVQNGIEGAGVDAGEQAAMRGSIEEAARNVIAAHHEMLLPDRGGLRPWEMTRDEWANEVQASNAELDRYENVPIDDWSADAFAAEQRYLDLIPKAVGVADALGVLHDRILELARRAGYDVAEQPVERLSVARTAAVDAAQRAAEDAFDADQFTREMAAEAGEPVNTTALRRGTLSRDERALYDDMVAKAKDVSSQEKLGVRREQLAGGVRQGGEAAGRQVGRLEGGQRVIEKQVARADEKAAALEPRISGAEASAQAAEEAGVGKAVRFGERRGKMQRDVLQIQREIRTKEGKLSWLEGDVLPNEEARLAQGPREVAPGRFKPALIHGERLQTAISEMADALEAQTGDAVAAGRLREILADVPATMVDLQDRIGRSPEYLPGAIDEPTRGGTTVAGSERQLPYEGLTPSERAKKYGHVPQRIRTVQRELAREMQAVARNEAAVALRDKFAKQGTEILGEMVERGDLPQWQHEAFLEGKVDRSIDLAKEMERQGYTAWDPESPNGSVRPGAVTPESYFLPSEIATQFQRWWKPTSVNPLVRAYDLVTRGFKHGVLAMSPQWQVYNVIGNTFMATFGAGESPAAIYHGIRMARQLLKRETELGEVNLPPRLFGAGQAAERARMIAEQTEPRTVFGRAINRSYALNESVDNLGRSAVYLAKKAKGYSDEEAVKLGLQAMGDFSNLSPFEKDVVRRIVPFYSWARHITQASYHLAVEHPFRVAWMLHMGDLFASQDDTKDLPAWLQGSLAVGGGWYLPMGAANPYASSMGSVFTNPKDWPSEFFRSLNPIIKLGLESTGVNIGQGRLVSRPPGTGPRDEYGRPKLGWQGLGPVAYMAAQMVPQGRLLTSQLFNPSTREVLPDQVLRYDTGEPILSRHRRIPVDGGRLPTIARTLGVPFPASVDVAATQARIAKARAANTKAREAYFRNVG